MKFQRYMTGRGNRGYGFKASTQLHPQTSYMAAVRESDTGSTEIPVLEILTTSYGELGAVASFHAQEGRASGYMDILFPAAKDEQDPEWARIMENPGCLLYLPHVDQREFLRTSDLGNNVRISDDSRLAQDIPIPEIPHEYTFNLDDDTLADLVADVWYASSMRLNNPASPETWPVVHLQLTAEANQIQLMNRGREFFCNKLMPALPAFLRRIVSVSIGARYQDAVSAKNGGAAALVIPQFDADQTGMIPGRYLLTDTTQAHQPLNPLGDEKLWRSFGKAVLRFARTGTMTAEDNTDSWLNDFFSASELLKNQPISVNWLYAALLFNGHAQADMIGTHAEPLESKGTEKITDTFRTDVWETANPQLLISAGVSAETARECLLWLETDMIRAMNSNSQVRIDPETYEKLFHLAFSLPEKSEYTGLVRELKRRYDAVLIRDGNLGSGEMTGWLVNLLPRDKAEAKALVRDEEERLCSVVRQALTSSSFRPSDDHLRILAAYAGTGLSQGKAVTEYAVRLLEDGIDPQRVANLRAIQYEEALDESFEKMMSRRVAEVFSGAEASGFCNSIRYYIQNQPASGAKPAEELTGYLLQKMARYVSDHAEELRSRLGDVRQAFILFGEEQSEECMRALADCMEIARVPFTAEDQGMIQPVLLCGNDAISLEMAGALANRFDEALDGMFLRAVENSQQNELEKTVIDRQWTDCLKQSGLGEAGAQNRLKELMADSLYKYVSYKYRDLRPHLRIVRQAFGDIGMQDSREAMEAICDCMQEPGVQFTEEDAAFVRPVLTSTETPDSSARMCDILVSLFEDDLDRIVDRDSTLEKAYIACIRDRAPSEQQQRLKKAWLGKLKDYLDRNAAEMTSNVSRVMALYEAFEQDSAGTAAERTDSFCRILETRAREQGEGKMLTRQDLDVLQGKALQSISEESKGRLVEVLQVLFEKDLPRMIGDSNARTLWQECFRDRKIGQPLRERAVGSVQEYIRQSADEMYGSPVQVMEVCDAFGADASQKLDVWIVLLNARIRNEKGQLILNREYNDTLAADIQRARPDVEFARAVAEAFREDLPLMAEGMPDEQWARFHQEILPPRNRNDFDEAARQYYLDYISEQISLCRKGNAPDCLGNLLKLLDKMGWFRDEKVRESSLDYLRELKRETLSAEEMRMILEFRHDAGEALNEIFGRDLMHMAGNIDEEKTAVWHKAVEKGIDLKKTFSDTVNRIVGNPEQFGVSADQIIRPLLTTGKALDLGASAALPVIGMIARRKTENKDRLMTPEERDILQETVLTARDPAAWRKYLELLNWDPSDPENEERDVRLKADAAALRKTAFPLVTQDQAKEMRGFPVWKTQLQDEIRRALTRLSGDCGDYESLCGIPEKWGQYNLSLPFLQFSDLLSYEDADALEAACAQKAGDIIGQTSLTALKQKDLYDKSTWFGRMLGRMTAERVSSDSRTLVNECGTPAAAQDLLNLIEDTGSEQAARETAAALSFILDGRKGSRLGDIARQLQTMDAGTRSLAAGLLDRAVFGQHADAWKEKWAADGEASRIGMAGLSCLAGEEPRWEEYLELVLDQAQGKMDGMKKGIHPVQRLLYAEDMLRKCGMEEYTEKLPEMLEKYQPSVFRQLRGAGLKGKALRPLKDRTDLAESPVYRLLFTK